MRRTVLMWCVMLAAVCSIASGEESVRPEPNVKVASRWWPRLTNVYTPVGWKNHLFRFNVFYDGTVLAQPKPPNGISELDPWSDQGVQLMLLPSDSGYHPYAWRSGTSQLTTDNGRRWGYQGWTKDDAPVLWTDWRQSWHGLHGVVLREEVFAHVPGTRDIESGTEPLFAWIRVSVKDRNPMVERERCGFLVEVTSPHIHFEMYAGRNVVLREDEATYPRELSFAEREESGAWLIEPDDRVRLGAMPGPGATVELHKGGEGIEHPLLWCEMPATIGAHVDLLLPMIPQEKPVFEKELKLGRAAALAECNEYWSRTPATAARIVTPEPFVNSYLKRSIQFGEIIAQKMPGTDFCTNLTGSLVYSRMWATPTTTFDTMLLDTLGYHDAVDRYLEILRATQGTVKPPGPSYEMHPGYFATPKSLTSYDWLSDHGAILYAASYHAMLTDDSAFIDRWLEPVMKGCEFIRDARKIRDHEGVAGLLPPAVATDRNIPTQAVWNIGWHYKGLLAAAELLKRIDHPRADEFAAEAEDFKTVFLQAFRERSNNSPTWTDREGNVHPVVPTSLSPGADTAHPFYLDTGPLTLVYAGLLDADDPLMESAIKFFREGPNHRLYDPEGHFSQPPVLVHEISSCEPCYSWSFFHSHQKHDRYRYLEGLYSSMIGGHARTTHIQCETRHGITGITGAQTVYLVRLSVVDDLVEKDELHLLRLVPKAWLTGGRWTRFERIPTTFGPVTVQFRLADAGRELSVRYTSAFHHSPKRVLLHVPPIHGLEKVAVNGRSYGVAPGGRLELE